MFIEAHRRYYAMDLAPGFWSSLIHHVEEGRMASIDKVRVELGTGDDLGRRARKVPTRMFVTSAETGVVRRYGEMIDWVERNPQFKAAAKAEFASVADGWLAARASVHGDILVTHEVSAPEAKKRVPLPNLCEEFGVPVCNTFTMPREVGVSFSWAGPPVRSPA